MILQILRILTHLKLQVAQLEHTRAQLCRKANYDVQKYEIWSATQIVLFQNTRITRVQSIQRMQINETMQNMSKLTAQVTKIILICKIMSLPVSLLMLSWTDSTGTEPGLSGCCKLLLAGAVAPAESSPTPNHHFREIHARAIYMNMQLRTCKCTHVAGQVTQSV